MLGKRTSKMADSRGFQFQQDIIDALAAQGWLVGPANRYDLSTVTTSSRQWGTPYEV